MRSKYLIIRPIFFVCIIFCFEIRYKGTTFFIQKIKIRNFFTKKFCKGGFCAFVAAKIIEFLK